MLGFTVCVPKGTRQCDSWDESEQGDEECFYLSASRTFILLGRNVPWLGKSRNKPAERPYKKEEEDHHLGDRREPRLSFKAHKPMIEAQVRRAGQRATYWHIFLSRLGHYLDKWDSECNWAKICDERNDTSFKYRNTPMAFSLPLQTLTILPGCVLLFQQTIIFWKSEALSFCSI